jgi:TonB family protein
MSARIQLDVMDGDKVVSTQAYSGDSIEIGKLSRCDLKLEDSNVSRRHARIEIDKDDKVHVIDLGSTNGTRLNGMRVNKAALNDGDQLEIGMIRIRVRFGAELVKASATAGPSARTAISRDGFYRTEEDSSRKAKGRLALEGALLWEDSPIQVDAFERALVPVRLKAALLLLFAAGPFELLIVSAIAAAAGFDSSVSIATGAAGLGLLVYLIMDIDAWKDSLFRSLSLLKKGEAVYVGETAESRFFVPAEALGQAEYPLLVPHKSGWGLNLHAKGIRGDLLYQGKVMTLDQVRSSNILQSGVLPLGGGNKARLRFGQFSLLLSYVTVPPRPKGAWMTADQLQEWAYMAVSLLIHFGLLILFVYLPPDEDVQFRRNTNRFIATLTQVESIQTQEEEEEEEELPDKLEEEEEKEEIILEDEIPTLEQSEKFLPDEERDIDMSDKPDMVREVTKDMTPEEREKVIKEQKKAATRIAESMAPTQMLNQLTGKNLLNDPSDQRNIKIIGGGGDPSDPASGDTSAGALTAAAAGTGAGFAGIDMGSTSTGTGGVGGVNGGGTLVAGLNKKSANKARGINFKAKKLKAIVSAGSISSSGGGLTKKIIRKYINRQKGSVVYCYKKEVQKKPDLEGKVVVSFTISPTGSVMRPTIKSSTLGSASVESCMVRRMKLWKFPAPVNAGAVRVSYPFLFRTR